LSIVNSVVDSIIIVSVDAALVDVASVGMGGLS
jgi:hypothetical protein